MDLLTADYCILGAALCGAVIGLFIGFSGALAFLCGTASAVTAAVCAYPRLAESLPDAWMRGGAVVLGALVVFGLVRLVVRKFVHGLLAQPGDALFGALVAAVSGFSASLALAWLLGTLTGEPAFASALLERVLACVGR